MAEAQVKLDKIVLDDAGFKELLHGGMGVREALRAAGEQVLASAKANTPGGARYDQYRNSLRITETQLRNRMAVDVGSFLPYASAMEAKHSILARALGSSGLRLGGK